ncbi:MAG: alpha/beta hydrolase [Bacteroidota bacterium]
MNKIKKSKIINNSFKIPNSLLYTGKTLQFLSKNLTVRFLAKIFETPPKFKIPEREIMMQESTKNETHHIPSIQKDIMVYTYGYSKKKVLLLHGWSGRGTQMHHLADKILENRMMVVTLDAPAHGLSSGKTTNMLEYLETIEFIEKKYGPFDAAIGHSWGGMTLLNAAARKSNIKKLVIIGADDKISDVIKSFVKKFELSPILIDKMIKYYNKKLKFDINSFSSGNAAKKIKIPTFIIHDSQDRFVPVSSAYKIRQNIHDGLLLITNGLGHHKIFKDKKVTQKIIEFIQ